MIEAFEKDLDIVFESSSETNHRYNYPTPNIYENLELFIDHQKRLINHKIEEHELGEDFYISEEEFQKMLARVESYKKKGIKTFATEKSEIDKSLIKGYLEEFAENADALLLHESEELTLVKDILKYPEVLSDAVSNLEPYMIAYYLIELARDFHSFYQKHRVVTDDIQLTQARLYLINKVALTIKAGLELLGVSCPEEM